MEEKNQKELFETWRKDLSETGEARRRYMTLKKRGWEKLNRKYRLEKKAVLGCRVGTLQCRYLGLHSGRSSQHG